MKGEIFIFQSQMDESKPLEEIRTWEHPPWYGIDQFKEKVTLIFLENQKGLFHHLTTHFRMPVKQLMISGPCQETSYTAMTSNQESNFTRREKNHSLFHLNTLMYPELRRQTWMLCKKAASMIFGISMGQETCRILGQVSHNLLHWKKNLQTEKCGLGGAWQESSWHPGQIIYGQNSGRNWEEMHSWRRSKSGHMKSSIWITHENCKGCSSLTRRTRNSKKPSRAENFGDLITADHKVLSDNCESRNNHRYAVVVQDLATQWIQAYPCKTKTSQETQRSLQKFLEPDRNPNVIYTLLESMRVNTTQIRNKWDCRKSSAQSERRHLCCIVAIRSGQRLVGGFHGVLLLSVKRHRSSVWWEDTIWKAVRNAL